MVHRHIGLPAAGVRHRAPVPVPAGYSESRARVVVFHSRYDRTDQLVSQDNGVPTSFTYDPYGNLTSKAESASTLTAMTYDAAGRLVAITPASGVAATFTLDALGRHRTRVLSSGGTDTYAYLGSSGTVHEVSNTLAGTTRSLLDPGGSRLAVKAGAAAASFTLFDHLGSLIGLVNGSRTITGATRFDGYGETVATTGATVGPWRFRGTLDVSPSGDPLYAMGARYYAPSIGAFTQADTYAGSAANPASMNRFLYAEANPATLIDPTGHRRTRLLSGRWRRHLPRAPDREGRPARAGPESAARHQAAWGRSVRQLTLAGLDGPALHRQAHPLPGADPAGHRAHVLPARGQQVARRVDGAAP